MPENKLGFVFGTHSRLYTIRSIECEAQYNDKVQQNSHELKGSQ